MIVRGYSKDSYLPIEVDPDYNLDTQYFDKNKHKSHLLNCEEVKNQWEEVKKEIAQQEKRTSKLIQKHYTD